MKELRASLVQIVAEKDPESSARKIERYLAEAPPTDVFFLPECCLVRGGRETRHSHALSLEEYVERYFGPWALRYNAWVVAGNVDEKTPEGLYSTLLVVNRRGELVTFYRKIHLFSFTDATGHRILDESQTYLMGGQPTIVDIEGWKTGLSICYDIRFPELYRYYVDQGVSLICIPANFTYTTGEAHWEVLCRARAIENLVYVVAPNQCGCCPELGHRSWGHSLVVSPWGKVVACGSAEEEGVISAVLDPKCVIEARSRLQALEHRKINYFRS